MVKNVIILKLLSKSLTTEWNLLNRPIIFKIIIDARIKKKEQSMISQLKHSPYRVLLKL